jgi:predicted metal-dependent phosphoesterase TrpH
MNRESVVFAQPQHKEIQKEGFTAVDMHNHSCYSDTTTTLDVIAKKTRKLGIGLSLTDHNAVAGNIAIAKQNPDLFVVPGLEITTKEMAHVLTYFDSHNEMQDFFDKHIKKNVAANPFTATDISVTDLVDISKDYNCVLAPAHPFAFPRRFSFISAMERGFVDKDVLKSLTAVETICGANIRGMNQKAVAWASSLNKAAIGGSDSHSIGTFGRVVTTSGASTVSDFLDSIRKKKTRVIGVEDKMHQRPLPLAKIASQHLKYLRPTMKKQYDLNIRQPVLGAKKALRQRLSAEHREERRSEIRVGMASLVENLHFSGFPRIKKRVAMRWRKGRV